MKEDPSHYRSRNSMRDPRIDYTRGNFFVTICLEERRNLFGSVDQGVLVLNEAGRMIEELWLDLAKNCPGLVLDCHVVMPDHFHAVLAIVETRLTHPELAQNLVRPHLSNVVRDFKRRSTLEYGRGVKLLGWSPYRGQFWQPGFWDHHIEDDADLELHREYVMSNPMRWHLKRQGMM